MGKKYFLFNKNDNFKLSKNFSSKEFQCKCSYPDCIEQRVSVDLIENLQKLRDEHSSSITITSGYRCEKHNKDIGGSPRSQHIHGNAADLKTSNMTKLLSLVEKFFKAIGNNIPSFIHVDERRDRQRRWTY